MAAIYRHHLESAYTNTGLASRTIRDTAPDPYTRDWGILTEWQQVATLYRLGASCWPCEQSVLGAIKDMKTSFENEAVRSLFLLPLQQCMKVSKAGGWYQTQPWRQDCAELSLVTGSKKTLELGRSGTGTGERLWGCRYPDARYRDSGCAEPLTPQHLVENGQTADLHYSIPWISLLCNYCFFFSRHGFPV